MTPLIGTKFTEVTGLLGDYNYNPCVFKTGNTLSLLYRTETRENYTHNGSQIAVVEISPETYQPVSQSKIIDLPHRRGVEDPRILHTDNHTYIAYSSQLKQHLCEVDKHYNVVKDRKLTLPVENSCEKNWTYFTYEGKVYCIYSLNPGLIYRFNEDTWELTEAFRNDQNIEWRWGPVRGGSNPVCYGDFFHIFFHSCYFHPYLDLFMNKIYVAGYLEMEATPPFRIKFQSSEPILWPDFADSEKEGPARGCAVIFPCGAVRTRDKWLVSYGDNDRKCKIAEIDPRELNLLQKKVN